MRGAITLMIAGAGCADRALMPREPSVDLAVVQDLASVQDLARADLASACLVPPDSHLQGTTPLGAVNLPYGWLGYAGGDCSFWMVDFTPQPVHDSSALMISFSVRVPSSAQPFESNITVHNAVDFKTGTVQVDAQFPADPTTGIGEATGTLSVHGDGWDLDATFTAHRCRTLDTFCVK